MEPVEVDGSQGEGGGQILRAAVAFSAILHKPVRVDKIRAGREVPGLKRQHVSALRVLAEAFDGQLIGATEGSSSVTFVPGAPKLTSLTVDMGTAASITLVLQAVIPAVSVNGGRLSLGLVGGTDVPWSPTFDYFDNVVRSAFGSVGVDFRSSASRRGYYPRGGGRVVTSIGPCTRILALDLARKMKVSGAKVVSRCGSLPRHVAERQLSSALKVLEAADVAVTESEVSEEPSSSPGSSVLVCRLEEGVYIGADAIGARGKPAEEVGQEAAQRFVAAAETGACVDSNLADMLLPILSMAGGPSRVRVPELTEHLRSGLDLAVQFTSCAWSFEESDGATVVKVEPSRPD